MPGEISVPPHLRFRLLSTLKFDFWYSMARKLWTASSQDETANAFCGAILQELLRYSSLDLALFGRTWL